ncbi:signal recognition particle, SRP9/SRP14 subunit [Violaceomyces palustris]|uniref:Signal recognition particle, SRP9/SRP14 subunit n=1 Tax=Violaceomyces palustris TaxID=1673888 RepID=A0ACD0P3R6_9BASI|nr:signal recognition particle, SRP9/SRP14 subunit [Violaceomyces palustris]
MLLTNDQFIQRLSGLFEASQTKHSVYISSKRCTDHKDGDGDVSMTAASASSSHEQSSILFRATDGQQSKATKIKFSTLVHPDHVQAFNERYLPLLRSQLSSCLKKRDKAKERKVEKQLTASRKKIEAEGGKVRVSGVGSKRGAGRRKRQRVARKAMRLRSEKAKEAAKEKKGKLESK